MYLYPCDPLHGILVGQQFFSPLVIKNLIFFVHRHVEFLCCEFPLWWFTLLTLPLFLLMAISFIPAKMSKMWNCLLQKLCSDQGCPLLKAFWYLLDNHELTLLFHFIYLLGTWNTLIFLENKTMNNLWNPTWPIGRPFGLGLWLKTWLRVCRCKTEFWKIFMHCNPRN